MKIKNNQFIFLKYYIYIIIILVVLSIIHNKKCNNCEISSENTTICITKTDAPSPSDNCDCDLTRTHFGDTSCYLCNQANGFYSIDSNDNCQDKTEGCPNKIIIDTNECVGHCPEETCQMGDYCYSNYNDENPHNIELETTYFKHCKCKYKYYKHKTIEGKEKYKCLAGDEKCPKYYNSDTNECVDDCGSYKIKEYKDGDGNIIEKECRARCNFTEFYYKENNTCLESCPLETFVYENYDGTKDCLLECNEENFYEIKENNIGNCLFNCSKEYNYITLYDFLLINNIHKLVKQCIEQQEVNENIYEYNEVYFKNCSYTKNVFNKITYLNIYQNKCIEDCFSEDSFLNEKNCVNECQEPKQYYYDKTCLINCDTNDHKYDYNMDFSLFNINNYFDKDHSIQEDKIIEIKKDNFPNPYKCLENCPSGTFTDTDNKKCYISSCNEGKYINSNLECKACNVIQNQNNIQPGEGFIMNEIIFIDNGTVSEGTRILEENNITIFNITRKYCLSSCPKSSPYHNFKENECYSTDCKDRGKYSAYDNPYVCYNSCNLIESDNYKYENDYICYKTSVTCDNYYFITKDKLTQCASYEQCVEKQFKYIKGKECTNECDKNDYIIEKILNNEGKIQTIGSCLLDKKDCIKEGNIFFNQSERICRKECDAFKISSDTPIEDDNGDTCFSSCPSNYPYKDLNNKLCLTKCENFFYEYDCYDSCNQIQKKYFEGTKKCVDSCKIGNKFYYKTEDNDDVCYYSCPESYPFVKSASTEQREPYQCIKECGDKKFYYEDKKVCRDTCDILYKNENKDNKICVYQCESGQKVIKKNNNQYCIDSCPSEAPYIINEKLSDTNPLIVEKCTNKCPYSLISNSTKKCLPECTFSESYKYEGVCYEKCPQGTFSDEYNRICYKDKCPIDYKFYETDEDGINICKKNCPSGKYYLLDGGECMEKCPEEEYKYIGFNKICLKECSGDYGEYKEKKGDIDNYNCLKICDNGKFTVNETKECVSECDPDKYYTSTSNNFCYEKCINDKNNPFSTHDENDKKICAIKCKDSEPNYGNDKICKNGCDDDLIMDYDGACVSECKNLYYKYIDMDNKKCVNECNKFIIKDNKCVNQCESPYNYIEGNECKKQCDADHFSQEIDNTNIFNCITKCDKDKYYYETGSIYLQKKCLSKCEDDKHFVIQDTQICIPECPSPYKSYYSDNSENSIYKQNLCVLQCPNDKPYSYNNKCLKECPSGYQYHIENENICIKECPEGSKIDQNTCKSICPKDQFIDINDKCVESCPDRYKYYYEGIYKCLPNCGNDYKEGDKCVKSCSDKNPYLIEEETECSNKCKDNLKNYVVKNFTQGENNIQRKCLTACPEKYTYIETYKENEIEINFCIDKCNYKIENTTNCLLKCEGEYIFYDYENGKCFKNCPESKKYYANDTENEYFVCYEKCPSHIPYFNKSNNYECMESCDTNIINITSKECLNECHGKEYTDSEITYCLNKCDELGLFQFDNQCVKDCSKINDNLVVNMDKKTCECKSLFYYDSDNKTKCITGDICNEDKKRLLRTNQCLDNCTDNDNNYTLSLDGKYCLPSEDSCPINTIPKAYNINGIEIYKCDCSYKFYLDESETKICLSENEECPSNYTILDVEKNECKSNCLGEDYITIGKICIKKGDCVGNDQENFYWYIDHNNEYKCINKSECLNKSLILVENTKQCVKSCTNNNNFNIYSNINGKNECLSSCKSIKNTIIKSVQNSAKSEYECFCTDLWYKDDNGKIYCNEEDDIKTCEEFNDNKTILIKETKECVNECNDDYQYLFDGECLKKCEDVKRYYGFDVMEDNNTKECRCKNIWKTVNNKTICINNNNLCFEENYKLLNNDTKECISECPSGYILFNNTCYKETCPPNTERFNGSCKCINKWYEYNDNSLNIQNIIICFENESDDCPKDFYPYLYDKKCVEECSPTSIIFNYTCYDQCPNNTIEIGGQENKSCQCDKNKGFWYQFIYEGKKLYQCGLNECPKDKKYIDEDSQECIFSCGNKYHYQGICYSKKCPNNTQLVDEISKECVESFTFSDAKDLESLEENVESNIQTIYKNSSSGGIVYNLNNSTMQIYGVNKNKKEKKDLIMRTNLTYIDLSNCIDTLYEKRDISSDKDLIIVKYDRGDITNSTTINPVEYKVFDPNTGESIDLKNYCEDNSIIISYPLSTILNNFVHNQNLRNLEDKNENLNLRDKFLKGKELNSFDEEIDSFNIDNKLYTDICYKCKINGKDLILEDRFNYLYPLYSFCESNCIYDKTDFILERVYCNCTPRSDFNLERNFELLNIDANVEKVKDNQKGSILKCISSVKNISKNFGFFYGLIIILVEIGLAILTILYSYKVFLMNIKNQFDINGDNKVNNMDTENIENLSDSKKYKNKKEEMIKTSERNLEYPPKKKVKVNIIDDKEDKKSDKLKKKVKKKEKEKEREKEREKEKVNEAEIINIKNTNKNVYDNHDEKLSSNNSFDEKSSVVTFKDMEEENIFDYIKLEKKLLLVDYNDAIQKNKAEILIMILTEILDKIYIIKAIWLLQKFELFSLYFSLYLLWHMLVLSFLSVFYNNANLHKIWINDDYPNLNYHLSFGFLSCIISFVFYRGLYFLINNDKKINEIELIEKERKDEIEQQYKKMMFWAQIKIIIFYAVQLILILIFYIYLIAFFGIYEGTSSKLVESYGIALIEVIIIKILYGLILGIMRKISLVHKIEKLYSIVRFLDLYIA